jgi:hypothetical protein
MRPNRIKPYRSILDALDFPGCPICRFLKNHQSILMQEKTTLKIRHLCNFHTWGVAATQQTVSAANLFQVLLSTQEDSSLPSDCDICIALRTEERHRIQEFVKYADGLCVTKWLRSGSAFCVIHGAELERLLPSDIASEIVANMRAYRLQLGNELSRLRESPDPESAKGGTLGHAAEFLISQRGLRP